MLDKREGAVMEIIYEATIDNKSCIIKTLEFLKLISFKHKMSLSEVDAILDALALEEYFEIVRTEKNGEAYYIFNLHKKGEAFEREIIQRKRAIKFKIMMGLIGVGFALGGGVLAVILRAFGKI